MKKVYGLQWTGNSRIRKGLFDHKADADREANLLNKSMTTFQKIVNFMTYGKWVVVEMNVQERGIDV